MLTDSLSANGKPLENSFDLPIPVAPLMGGTLMLLVGEGKSDLLGVGHKTVIVR